MAPMRSNALNGLIRAAAKIALLTVTISVGVAAPSESGDENARIADWRAKRLASLTSETGWLTPIALYWLKEGENSFGRAPNRAFSLDDAALAADTGAFILTDGHVRYVAHASKAMTYLGKPVTSLDLVSDSDEKPTELIAGSLHFMLIERAGHLGIRVRDSVSPNRLQFKGLQVFSGAGRLAYPGALRALCARAPYPDRQHSGHDRGHDLTRSHRVRARGTLLAIGCHSGGAGGPGVVRDVLGCDERQGDLRRAAASCTSDCPTADRIEVDFNEAYNPPCAFTDFATCPLPPQQNRLALGVDAGELKYERAH